MEFFPGLLGKTIERSSIANIRLQTVASSAARGLRILLAQTEQIISRQAMPWHTSTKGAAASFAPRRAVRLTRERGFSHLRQRPQFRDDYYIMVAHAAPREHRLWSN